jgi:hypothetical protein
MAFVVSDVIAYGQRIDREREFHEVFQFHRS